MFLNGYIYKTLISYKDYKVKELVKNNGLHKLKHYIYSQKCETLKRKTTLEFCIRILRIYLQLQRLNIFLKLICYIPNKV